MSMAFFLAWVAETDLGHLCAFCCPPHHRPPRESSGFICDCLSVREVPFKKETFNKMSHNVWFSIH